MLIGLGSPMVIYGLVRPLTIERESKLLAKHAPETHFCWRSWVIAHVGLKRKL